MPSPKRFQYSLRTLFVVTFAIGVVLAVIPAITRSRAAAQRTICTNNLRQVALALHNFHDINGSFPKVTLDDSAGLPMHSWRIVIIPLAEQIRWYELYRFDEPWNSRQNTDLFYKPILLGSVAHPEQNPYVTLGTPPYYQCPSSGNERSKPFTNIVAVSGPNTAFPRGKAVSLNDIKDGPANTIIAAEIDKSDIHWLEPRDLDVQTMSFRINDKTKPSISSRHPGGALVMFADGAVFFLRTDTDPETLRAMLTIDGGEKVDREQLVARGWLRQPNCADCGHELLCQHSSGNP